MARFTHNVSARPKMSIIVSSKFAMLIHVKNMLNA